MRDRSKSEFLAYLLISPALVLVVLVLVLPMLQNAYFSFFEWDGIGEPIFNGIDNYLALLNDSNFFVSLSNTLIWVLATLFFPVALGLGIAIFVGGMRLGTLFKGIFFLPLTVSFVATGAIWSNMFSRDFGVLNGVLGLLGFDEKVNWLTSVPLNTISMLLAWVWQQLGTNMVLFLAGLATIPRDPAEAALIDGASKWQTFIHVTFPMLTPITTIVTTMALVNSFKAFDIIYVLTKGGPYRSSETLAVTMFRETFTMSNMGYGAAISLVLSVLVMLVSIGYIRGMWRRDLLYY